MALLPGGKQFVSGSKDKTLKLWEVASGASEGGERARGGSEGHDRAGRAGRASTTVLLIPRRAPRHRLQASVEARPRRFEPLPDDEEVRVTLPPAGAQAAEAFAADDFGALRREFEAARRRAAAEREEQVCPVWHLMRCL